MTNKIIYIALVALVVVAFFFGKGCRDDDAVQDELDKSRERIERYEAEKDSLEAIRGVLADSLTATLLRIDEAEADKNAANVRARAALAQIQNMPTYETLSDDDLAFRADSLYSAGTGG